LEGRCRQTAPLKALLYRQGAQVDARTLAALPGLSSSGAVKQLKSGPAGKVVSGSLWW